MQRAQKPCLRGEKPKKLQVIGVQAALGGEHQKQLMHLVHVLSLVKGRAQECLHYVVLHKPCYCILHHKSELWHREFQD